VNPENGQNLNRPPEALLMRKVGTHIVADSGELARAQWFWERRPKKLILSTERALKILILYGSFWLAAMCLYQQTLVMTVLSCIGYPILAAMPVWAYIDAVRWARWKADYSCAILRLLQTVRRC
jgi:hypothetical protein